MKPQKESVMKTNLINLDQFVETIKDHCSLDFQWKSPIHLRIIIDGKWTDFWPTTGRWYDFHSKNSGSGVDSLSEIVSKRLDTRPFVLSFVPMPPKDQPKPIESNEERLFLPNELHIDPSFVPNQFSDDDEPPW